MICKIRDVELIYYHGPYQLWNITGGPYKITNFILKLHFYLHKENK